MIEFESEATERAASPTIKIAVLGVGGAGGNTVNALLTSDLQGIDCIAVNTDAQALKNSCANTLQIGTKLTKGLGAGANPEIGKRAAEEDLPEIVEAIKGCDIVFLTGGLGGGTGSGALPVIARSLKDRDVLSVAVVTKPFAFEGKRRMQIAHEAEVLLRREVDTLVTIPNQKLLNCLDNEVSLVDAFAVVHEIMYQFVKSIADIIVKPGHINVDFADIKTIMKGMGQAVMGTGRAKGVDRAQNAARAAIESPLLDSVTIQGARSVLLNVAGSSNLGLGEISQAVSLITKEAHEEANIILGSVIDESMGDEVSVTVIATGFIPGAELHKQPTVGQPVVVQPAIEQPKQVTPAPIEVTAEPITFVEKAVVVDDEPVISRSAQKKIEPAHEEPAVQVATDTSMQDDLEIPAFLRKLTREKQIVQQNDD